MHLRSVFFAALALFALSFCQKKAAAPPVLALEVSVDSIQKSIAAAVDLLEKKQPLEAWLIARNLAQKMVAAPVGPTDSLIGRLDGLLFKIGNRLDESKQFSASIECFETALRLAEKRPDLFALSVASNTMHLGVALRNLGQIRESLPFLERADSLFGTIKTDRADSIRIWGTNHIALAHKRSGDHREAIRFYEKSLERSQKCPIWRPAFDSYALCDMASSIAELGKTAEAEALLERGKTVAGPRAAPFIEENWTPKLADIFLENGHATEAAELFKKSLAALSKKHPDGRHPDFLKAHRRLGAAFWAAKKEAEAAAEFNAAQKCVADFPTENGLEAGRLWQDLAKMAAQKDRLSAALDLLEKAEKAAEPTFDRAAFLQNPTTAELRFPAFLLAVAEARGQLFRQLFDEKKSSQKDDLQAALEAMELAAALVDRLRTDFFDEATKADLSASASRIFESGLEICERLNALEDDQKWLEKAFFFVEKSKSVRLLETARAAGASDAAGIPVDLRAEERRLRMQLAGWQNAQKLAEDYGRGNLQEAKDSIFSLKKRQRDLQKRLENGFSDYFRRKYDVRTISAKAALERLKAEKGAALIDWFWGQKRLWVVVLEGEKGLSCRSILLDSVFLKPFGAVVDGFSAAPVFENAEAERAAFSKTTRAARQLFRQLLEPFFDSNFDAKKWPEKMVFAPDGPLARLPFEALLTADFDEKGVTWRGLPWLLNRSEVGYAFSATLFFERKKPSDAPVSLGAFAPKYDEKAAPAEARGAVAESSGAVFPNLRGGRFRPLKNNQKEATAVAAIEKGQFFGGAAANESDFKKRASDFRQLHFAMHAEANDSLPELSQLVFSENGDAREDGRLYAWELLGLPIRADLAVLSACETGRGHWQRGEGVQSLARAFRLAGCPNVALSLWQADDASAEKIMVDFWTRLEKGGSQAAALASAKRSFLENASDERMTHPFFWAGFVKIGASENAAAGPFPAFFWLVLIGLIFSTLLFLGFKKRLGRAFA